MTQTVEELVRLLGSPAAIGAIAPYLHVSAGIDATPIPARPEDAAERAWLARDGVAELRRVVAPQECADLVRAVGDLARHGLPATLLYAFDEAWSLGERVRARLSAALGRRYRLVEDVWAWSIAPGTGRGWPAHRGIAHALLERDAPEILNVWVALTDVTAERACMHAVPLDDDPHYPSALTEITASLGAVRALPISAGDALFWNANVLHWGGPCAARAIGPRVSCSFTLVREDAAARFPELVVLGDLGSFDLSRRMDALARMILLYGDPERGDVKGPVRDWAALTRALVARFSPA